MTYNFKTGNPPVAEGQLDTFIVFTEFKEVKRVFPAQYLNGYRLEFEDGCSDQDCNHDHEEGCPVTGWFYNESNLEYENCYYRIAGDALGWAYIPTVADAEMSLKAT